MKTKAIKNYRKNFNYKNNAKYATKTYTFKLKEGQLIKL